MIDRQVILLGLFLLILPVQLQAQGRLKMTDERRTNFSFQYEVAQNLMIIPVRINNSALLKFVLDSGISNTIITEMTGLDTLSLNFARQITIAGLGAGPPVEAWYSAGNRIALELPEKNEPVIAGDSLEVYILMQNLFELSQQLGVQVNGLIGSDFFMDFVVEVDPVGKYLSFWKREKFNFKRVRRGYSPIPLRIRNKKAYTDVTIVQENGTALRLNLLIDTGASLPMWVAPSADPGILLPSKTVKTFLGQGLSGDITGVNGRLKALKIGKFEFRRPIISFPDSAGVSAVALVQNRQGSLGNDILRRFSIVYDFQGQMMYLKPNKWFSAPFSYNKSGMDVEMPVPGVPIYQIFSVITDSPAYKAGLKPGDLIESINYLPVLNLNLDDINNILHGENGKTVNLRISRDGLKYTIRFKLENKI